MRPTFIIAAGFAVLPILSASAWAQANRTFVSGLGSDSNPCNLSAPCRSFTGAITQTNAGGEIVVLDSAGYGSVTITKSISINAPDGIEGGITVTTATDAIDINIGASDVVNLRGLTLVGSGVGNFGIRLTNLGTLNIQNCVIRGFFDDGIELAPAGSANLNVSDTIVSNNGKGFHVVPTGAGTVTAAFNGVQATGNVDGFFTTGLASTGGAINVTIANSVASSNVQGVATASTTGKAVIQVMVVNSVLSNSNNGVLENGANSTTYLGKNTISGNTTAFNIINSGAMFSFGDNYIKSNGDDGGAITLVTTK